MSGAAAIMQPYFFPYLGYFQLIDSAATFVFYDDVDYVKRGWINRNHILTNKNALRLTIPVRKTSTIKLIKDKQHSIEPKLITKIRKTLYWAYKTAPYYEEAIDHVMAPLQESHKGIADLAISSINTVRNYLGKTPINIRSSKISPQTQGLEKSDRLIAITKQLGLRNYINAPGGKSLYRKEYFHSHGVNLYFLNPKPITYNQGNREFVPNLSIIDAMMYCSKDQLNHLISQYTIE